MVEGDDFGTEGRELDVYLRVVTADHVVMATMQFLRRARPLSRKWLKDALDICSERVESGRGVPFPLHAGAINSVQRVGFRRIVVETRVSLIRVTTAVLNTVSID